MCSGRNVTRHHFQDSLQKAESREIQVAPPKDQYQQRTGSDKWRIMRVSVNLLFVSLSINQTAKNQKKCKQKSSSREEETALLSFFNNLLNYTTTKMNIIILFCTVSLKVHLLQQRRAETKLAEKRWWSTARSLPVR